MGLCRNNPCAPRNPPDPPRLLPRKCHGSAETRDLREEPEFKDGHVATVADSIQRPIDKMISKAEIGQGHSDAASRRLEDLDFRGANYGHIKRHISTAVMKVRESIREIRPNARFTRNNPVILDERPAIILDLWRSRICLMSTYHEGIPPFLKKYFLAPVFERDSELSTLLESDVGHLHTSPQWIGKEGCTQWIILIPYECNRLRKPEPRYWEQPISQAKNSERTNFSVDDETVRALRKLCQEKQEAWEALSPRSREIFAEEHEVGTFKFVYTPSTCLIRPP